MKKKYSLIIAMAVIIAMTLGIATCAFAYESGIICEGCSEAISSEEVSFNEEGEAECSFCGEILASHYVNELFPEGTQAVTSYQCPDCGVSSPLGSIEYDKDGKALCPECAKNGEGLKVSDSEGIAEPEKDEFVKIEFNTSDWAKSEVEEANGKNLIPAEMKSADFTEEVSREEFSSIAVKLYEKITGKDADYSTENLPFTDCEKASDYTKYVAAAYKLGITNGTSETTFSPSQVITREQLATMLYRVVAKAKEEGIAAKNVETGEAKFADEAEISEYAEESVYYMAQCGIIKGMSTDSFVPKGVATKEQAVLISNRIIATLY